MRLRVEETDHGVATAVNGDGERVRVAFAGTPFAALQQQLRPGDEIEALDGDEWRGTMRPALIVLEPRQLIDVTTLCACHRPYGFTASNGLMGKFDARTRTVPIQLGNLAGDLFDDCVHGAGGDDTQDQMAARFRRSVQRSFSAAPLAYTALGKGIDRDFFLRAEMLYRNIAATVPQLGDRLVLEPAFVCPQLGLQGRMDALRADRSTIVELKSGKCDEWRRGSKCKAEHELQMMLYNEMLHYAAHQPRGGARLLLFYCQYPIVEDVRYTMLQVQQAIAVRNALVHQERMIAEGRGAELLDALQECDFNTEGLSDRFYNNYCRPVITRFMERVQQMEPLTKAYFHAFTAFVAREQQIAKEAAYQGEVLRGLRLTPVCDSEGAITQLDATMTLPLDGEPDFRTGDMVVVFENSGDDDAPWSHQLQRAYITHIDSHSLQLRLAYRQRNDEVFHFDRLYAIMAGYMEAGFTAQFRGLSALLDAPAERRRLLLHGASEDEPGYHLLVGPPGTGKTSVALRDLVRERLDAGQTLLLMAYTNQAVDEICTMLDGVCPDYVRIGNENACAVEHRRHMMQDVASRAVNRQDVKRIIGQIRVVAGTVSALSACSELFALKSFDLTVVDEASQVLEPQIVPLLCRVGEFVLIGDHKQLPAVVVQPRQQCAVEDPLLETIGLRNLSDSYFERLLRLDARRGGRHTSMLCRQGRMHRQLMAFVNRHFYGGRLDTVPLPHQEADSAEPRLVFIDVQPADDTHTATAAKSNAAEAEAVAAIVADVVQRPHFNPSKTLGVIVPFRAQATAIRSALLQAGIEAANQITIDTVERYQGSQRDIIIFSTTITTPGQLDLISVETDTDDGPVDRKLNVALTRARERMIMVGNRRVLMRSSLYADWIENAAVFVQKGRKRCPI